MRLFAVLMLLSPFALAVDVPLPMTWTHNGLDVNGDPETLAAWQGKVTAPDDTIVWEETFDDPGGESRAWTPIVPIDYDVEYAVTLRAIDEAGNVSEESGIVAYTVLDEAEPSGVINLTIECPEGYTCNIEVR